MHLNLKKKKKKKKNNKYVHHHAYLCKSRKNNSFLIPNLDYESYYLGRQLCRRKYKFI